MGHNAVRHCLVALVLAASTAQALADDPAPVYVAEQGRDVGDCGLPVRPCKTIAYALGQARKGSELRIAAGTYAVSEVADVFRLLGGAVRPRAGYSRFDHFAIADPDRHRTVIAGVPPQFRDALMALGFHVVADPKPLDGRTRQAIQTYDAVRTSSGPAPCTEGRSGVHACRNVELLARVALADTSAQAAGANDVWGFKDLNTEREYAFLGLQDGLAVFDVTEPTAPFEVDFVRGHPSVWRDVKVVQTYEASADRWRSYAYVTVDAGGRLSVLDLTELPRRVRLVRRMERHAHNVFVSGVDFAFGVPLPGAKPLVHVLGGVGRFEYGAFRSFDASDPRRPTLAIESWTGYSHDAVAFRVQGAQAAACARPADDCDVFVDFNEDTFDVWDVTDTADPRLLSSTTYPGVAYTHSGWATEDGRYLFLHDELDEVRVLVGTTRVRVFDLADLANPVHVGNWEGPDRATEHNGAVRGNRHYLSHYGRGLVVLDITDPTQPEEVGHFDTAPESNLGLGGAWGIYPFLPSGNLLVSDISGGLFVLGDRTRQSENGEITFAARAFGAEEGDEVGVVVRRINGTEGRVAVDYRVVPASAGTADYTSSAGTLEWAHGDEGARRIAVPLVRDDRSEPLERLHVWLAEPQGGAVLGPVNVATVFIGDAGEHPGVGFAEARVAAAEETGRVIATIRRFGDPSPAVSVWYEVHDLTAERSRDFVLPVRGRLSWEAGDALAQTLVIPLVQDDIAEPAEQFEIHLVSPAGAVLGQDRLVVDIERDERTLIDDLMLFDEDFGWDVERLARGAVVRELPERVNIRAVVKGAAHAGSVRLTLSGPESVSRIVPADSAWLFPYGVPGGSLANGDYQLLAAAYRSSAARGGLIGARATAFRIAVPPLSSEAGLAAVAVGGVALAGYSPDVFDYRVQLPAATTSVEVAVTPAHRGASIVIADASGTSTTPRRTVPLVAGDTPVTVAVTAEDRVTTRNYSVMLNRPGGR